VKRKCSRKVIYTPVKMMSCKCQTVPNTSGDVAADEDEC
jgi:hypothetical protein